MVKILNNFIKDVKDRANAYVEINRLYKGKLDKSILVASYISALNKLKELGIDNIDIDLFGKNLTVNINQHRKDIHNFIKRGIILDLSDKEIFTKYLKRERLSPKDQEELKKLLKY